MADNKFFSSPSVDIIESSTKIIGDIFSRQTLGLMVLLREISQPQEKLLSENRVKLMVKSIVLTQIFLDQYQEKLKLLKFFH